MNSPVNELNASYMIRFNRLSRSKIVYLSIGVDNGAYDRFYLALTENLGAPFWDSDQCLTNIASQVGIDWIDWMG